MAVQVFQDTDQKEQEWSELEEQLTEAVAKEDYVAAAEVREQLAEISNHDDLDNLMTVRHLPHHKQCLPVLQSHYESFALSNHR